MRRSGIEPEFKRWQRLVITATLPAHDRSLKPQRAVPKYSYSINSFHHFLLFTSFTMKKKK